MAENLLHGCAYKCEASDGTPQLAQLKLMPSIYRELTTVSRAEYIAEYKVHRSRVWRIESSEL